MTILISVAHALVTSLSRDIITALLQSGYRGHQGSLSPPGTGMGRQEQLLGAKKRPNPTYAAEENQHGLAVSGSPLCRPWDRGDLLWRLSTFKSMTWFAKPKIDNVCDERLAEFPPAVPANLVDKFRARSNSLFQLMALPAQKIISLCGWEPCLLPYVVNFKDGQNQFVKDAETLRSPQGVDYGLNLCLNFHAADENDYLETNKDSGNSFRLQYDPKYVVCARDDNFRNDTPLEGTNVTATKISPCAGTNDSNMGVQIERSQNVVQDSCQTNNLLEKVDNDRSCNIAVKDSDTTHIRESSIMIQGANVYPRNEGTKDNDSSVMIISEQFHPKQLAETEKVCDEEICLSNQNSTCVASCLEACVNVDGICKMTSREDKTCANSEQGVITEVQTAQTNKVLTCPKGLNLSQR
ncbi:C3HC zinc finger-like, putative isoform 2 [Hibiscus syriacus]|uniref:C3HC zinc finger-like, putative isoform 2 n=1 Tax=Hibiscus syriacus TaxID=106335 RepID=A0A6A3AKT6_HIBSY|nr:C3HC zinc finger-like, putative isoform 2 [Hibiscus syriacus]